jgi:hypothetical protein
MKTVRKNCSQITNALSNSSKSKLNIRKNGTAIKNCMLYFEHQINELQIQIKSFFDSI